MLLTADIDLMKRDQAISGFSTVMDSDEFLMALRIAQPKMNVRSVKLTRIRYRPTRSCLGAYQIDIPDAVEPILAHITAYSQSRWDKLKTPIDDYHFKLKNQLLISLFPGDVRLPFLSTLMHHEKRKDILKVLLPTDKGCPNNIKTLGYKQQRRYAGRVDCDDGSSALLKHYRENGYHKSVLTTMSDCPSTARLRTPRNLGCSQQYQCLAHEWLPGKVLNTKKDTTSLIDSLYETGAALAEFHDLSTDKLPQRTPAMQAKKLNAVAATTARLYPPLTSLVKSLVKDIIQEICQEAFVTQRIHGDFHPSQVILMEEGQIAIIDHDENACGNPMVDLGLFIAHLLKHKYSGQITHNQAESQIEAFIEGYQSIRQKKVESTLHYHIAAGLLSIIHRSFRNHLPNWPMDTQIILEHINDIVHTPYLSIGLPRV